MPMADEEHKEGNEKEKQPEVVEDEYSKERLTTPKKQQQDREGVELLRQIFPELNSEELYSLHQNHVSSASAKKKRVVDESERQPSSNLGKRIWQQSRWLEEHASAVENPPQEPLHWRETELPDDFLRLPPDIAVRRFNERRNKWEYSIVPALEAQVIEQHKAHQDFLGQPPDFQPACDCYSRVLSREPTCGLGMTLCEQSRRVWVHSLVGNDGSRWFVAPPHQEHGGPAVKAGIRPGDWLIGINGQALIPLPSKSKARDKNLLVDAVSTIRYAPDPVVLHFKRVPPDRVHPLVSKSDGVLLSAPLNSPSLLDTTLDSYSEEESREPEPAEQQHANVPFVHPFVEALASKGLIKNMQDQIMCTNDLHQFTERTRQWESFVSFRLDAKTFELRPQFDPKDLPPSWREEAFDLNGLEVENVRPYAPSTPAIDPERDFIPDEYMELTGLSAAVDVAEDVEEDGSLLHKPADQHQRKPAWENYPGRRKRRAQRQAAKRYGANTEVFIPLMGVRKALCIRIVNTFMDGNRTAYTLWIYDAEAGREWYAPMRYLKDFRELRAASVPLFPDLEKLPFPPSGWGVFGNKEKKESEASRAHKCRQLEHFLRTLASLIYTHQLHPYIAEIAIHLQSFLGCGVSSNYPESDLHLQNQVTLTEAMCWQMPATGHSEVQTNTRLLLKRSIQRYVYRLFLLNTVQDVLSAFVDQMRSKGLKQHEIEQLEASGRMHLKERGMKDLEQIHEFLDQLQQIVVDSCMCDFQSISQRREFVCLGDFLKKDEYLERVVREGVREQIEIEVYAPLRGAVSRLLVNGWRHDDMEIHFKMKELRKRSQTLFRIPADKQSPSEWRSVSSILNEGVGMSTLPCAKLRAIVDAAREITRVFGLEHKIGPKENGKVSQVELGADDFLPIFIYCVVRAEMERPCALCVLLSTLCDPNNRIGEVGYYLASFEAAIAHIQEIDLTADREIQVPWNQN